MCVLKCLFSFPIGWMCVYNCVFKLPMLTAYVTAASVYVILPVQLYDARSWSWVADMLIKHFDIGKVFRLLEKCSKICQQNIRQNLQICVRAKQETGDKRCKTRAQTKKVYTSRWQTNWSSRSGQKKILAVQLVARLQDLGITVQWRRLKSTKFVSVLRACKTCK